MLIIIEKDRQLRKKLCDLLERERIIGVESITECVEKICKFRNQIKVIISSGDFLLDIHNKQLIHKICGKLLIDIFPIVGYYTKDDLPIKAELERRGAKYKLIECNEQDFSFPERYIHAVKSVYPDLVYDIKKAKELWYQSSETPPIALVDAREWLKDEGFVEVREIVEKIQREEKGISLKEVIPAIEEILRTDLGTDEKLEKDYKTLYVEMKEKYEQLAKKVQEILDLVKDA